MAGNYSHQINQAGLAEVERYLAEDTTSIYYKVQPGGGPGRKRKPLCPFIIQLKTGKLVQLSINTKNVYLYKGEKATGKNTDQIQELKEWQKKTGIPVFLLFVDVKLKTVYGELLDNLMNDYKTGGVDFPVFHPSRVGELTLFSIHSMPKVYNLPREFVDRMVILMDKNRNDPNQKNIFYQ